MAKKYYWLKLRNDWFSDKRVKKLRSIAGGDTYTIIYLKMQLLSLKNEGKLFFEGVEDDFASELALDLDEDVENVKVTVAFLMKNGLLELNDADEYLLTDVPDTIGSETAGAERVRRFRSNKKALQCNADVTERNISNKKCNTEIEIEKEIDIEIEKERELETGHPAPAAYGRYHNVILSDTELDGLKTELPGKWEYYIDRLSCHIASSGRKYKSHAATIFKWAQEDAAKKAPKKGIPDYTCKEGESL